MQRLPKVSEALAADSRVLFAYIFGGCAGGEVKPLSDVDLAVYLDTVDRLAEVKLDLFVKISDLLGTSEIDLVVLNTAPVTVAGRVLRSRRLLVDKEPFFRHRYESLTLRKFFDFGRKEAELLERRYGIGR